MPAEAKLDVRLERDVIGQVARYTSAPAFEPTRGARTRVEQATGGPGADVALVIDAAGAYLVNRSGWLRGRPGRPAVTRAALADGGVARLRAMLERDLGAA